MDAVDTCVEQQDDRVVGTAVRRVPRRRPDGTNATNLLIENPGEPGAGVHTSRIGIPADSSNPVPPGAPEAT